MASQDVVLDPGEDTRVSFEAVPTDDIGAGTHAYAVVTDDGSASGTLTVRGGDTPTGTTRPTNSQSSPVTGNTTATNETSDDGGGLLPLGLLQTIGMYLGAFVVVVYLILKALAIYLGY